MNNLCEEILSEDIKNISPFRMGNDGLYWERDLPNDKRSTPNGFIATIDYNAPREYEEVWKSYTVIDDETGRITSERRKNKFYKGMSKDEIEKSIEEQKQTYSQRLAEYRRQKEEKDYKKWCSKLKLLFFMVYFEKLDNEDIQEKFINEINSIEESNLSWKEKYDAFNQLLYREEIRNIGTPFFPDIDDEYANVRKDLGKEK